MKTTITLLFLFLFVMQTYAQGDTNTVNTTFMVFSDPHYYDPSLGTEGEAFQHYLDHDRKLLRESRELLMEAIEMISESDAQFVLIPGDLTKDGTLISHREFASLIRELEKTGKKVYVVPGNHDILNGESKSFSGDQAILVENISPEKFRENYMDFGYQEALYSDDHSLSYVVEPVDGLWILGLDACQYMKNQVGSHPITDGAFSVETLDWIDEVTEKASTKNKKIIVFMHHGIVEHYKGQEKFFGEYIVDDYKKISKKFASIGINIVFTGHYHSQDITEKRWKNGDYIYDIETGSLVTYPCPVRNIEIIGNSMQVNSLFLTQTENHPEDFVQFSKDYVHSGISGIAEKTLISYHLNAEDAAKLSGQIGDAFIAHYQGDEIVPDRYINMQGVGLLGRLMIFFKKKMIIGLYNDLPPADNSVTITIEP